MLECLVRVFHVRLWKRVLPQRHVARLETDSTLKPVHHLPIHVGAYTRRGESDGDGETGSEDDSSGNGNAYAFGHTEEHGDNNGQGSAYTNGKDHDMGSEDENENEPEDDDDVMDENDDETVEATYGEGSGAITGMTADAAVDDPALIAHTDTTVGTQSNTELGSTMTDSAAAGEEPNLEVHSSADAGAATGPHSSSGTAEQAATSSSSTSSSSAYVGAGVGGVAGIALAVIVALLVRRGRPSQREHVDRRASTSEVYTLENPLYGFPGSSGTPQRGPGRQSTRQNHPISGWMCSRLAI